jgi:hypothetical protein
MRQGCGPRVTIMAEQDPLVFVRVLQMIGSLDLIPRRASAERLHDAIRIDIELPVHERFRYEFFCQRVLTIPTVNSLRGGRGAAVADRRSRKSISSYAHTQEGDSDDKSAYAAR